MKPMHDYLATEVMTATPEKLQLMLVEAALRFGNRTRLAWREGDLEAGHEFLVKCQNVVAEMLAGLDQSSGSDLVRKVAAVYVFVYQALLAAGVNRSELKLGEAMRVLEVERDTWRQ